MSTESPIVSDLQIDQSDGQSESRQDRRNHHRLQVESLIESRFRWYAPIKFFGDLIVTLALLPLALPIVLIAAIAIKLTSPGPIFYFQERLGRRGRSFMLIKLRTMIDDAEASSGPVWATEDDPRITRVGRFLRNTHIDEFPQLWNVLCGHLSLIGPRPERPAIVQRLQWEIPYYSQRMNVRPGITGVAQLQLPADSDTADVEKKLHFDLYYVHVMNPWLDFRIFCFSAWLMVRTILKTVWSSIELPSREKALARIAKIEDADPDFINRLEEARMKTKAED